MILSNSKALVVDLLKLGSSGPVDTSSLEDMERSHIMAMLERAGWLSPEKAERPKS